MTPSLRCAARLVAPTCATCGRDVSAEGDAPDVCIRCRVESQRRSPAVGRWTSWGQRYTSHRIASVEPLAMDCGAVPDSRLVVALDRPGGVPCGRCLAVRQLGPFGVAA